VLCVFEYKLYQSIEYRTGVKGAGFITKSDIVCEVDTCYGSGGACYDCVNTGYFEAGSGSGSAFCSGFQMVNHCSGSCCYSLC